MLDKKTSINKLIRDTFQPIAKKRKAKSTLFGLYQKKDPYYWYIYHHSQSEQYQVQIKVKLWRYDEMIDSIVHPDNPVRFTDIMRHECVSAMPFHLIAEREYEFPCGATADNLRELAEEADFVPWCESIFNDCMEILDGFISDAEQHYGGLGEYLIAHAEEDPHLAVFACLDRKDYEGALKTLAFMEEHHLTYNRCYGAYSRDLRDVLKDYCTVTRQGGFWTSAQVVGHTAES